MLIWCRKQRLDFLPDQKADHRAWLTLVLDGQDTLNMRRMCRLFVRGIAEERADGRQPHIATADGGAALLLQSIEELTDQRRIQIRKVQARRRLAVVLLCEVQKQSERVSIRGDRMGAGLSLSHQTLREVALQQGRQSGRRVHGRTSQRRSNRRAACSNSSDDPDKYQNVSLICP